MSGLGQIFRGVLLNSNSDLKITSKFTGIYVCFQVNVILTIFVKE